MRKVITSLIIALILTVFALIDSTVQAQDECFIDLELGYQNGNLQMEWEIGLEDSAIWKTYLVLPSIFASFEIWSVPVPIITPHVNFSMEIPFPPETFGVIIIISILDPTTAKGCVAFDKVDTGTPSELIGTQDFFDGYDWMPQVPIRNPKKPVWE